VIGILATGSYLPKEEITNDDIAARFDVTHEWIERKTKIGARRRAAPAEAASDLAVHASIGALEQAGLSAEQIDYLIVVTSTGDFIMPPTSCAVQVGIGAHRAACLDVNVACSGFVYGVAVARGLVALAPGAHALVVAADVWTRFIDPADRSTSVLMGDGAGAAVIGAVPASVGIIDVGLHAYGGAAPLLVVPAGGSRQPPSHETIDSGGHYLAMRGREVTEFVLANVPGVIGTFLDRAGVRPDEVRHVVPHQANGVMVGNLVERAGLAGARVHLTLDRYGNVGSASIPVTLDEANRDGSLRYGDLVLLVGFGGGMALGMCLLRWANG
jgi:3-oxoacyl-[acyl-carrier-protein] synthase-3